MPAPAAPTNLAVSSFSASAAALGWTASVGATAYLVWRSKASATGWDAPVQINAAAVLTNSYTDNAANSTPDPEAGATYQYFVTAENVDGESGPSGIVTASFVAPAQRVPGDFEDDIQSILATDPMADEASYTRFGYAPVTIKGWFDNDNADNEGRNREHIQNSAPQFTCATADVEYASNRDTLVLAGLTFYVTGVAADGTGMTILELSRNAPE